MTETPTPQVIPSDADFERGERVVEQWLRRFPAVGVAPASNAANALRDLVAVAVAEGRLDELVAEQGEGPVELEAQVALHVAQDRRDLVERLRELAPTELKVATLYTRDDEAVRIVSLDELVEWLTGCAIRAAAGGAL